MQPFNKQPVAASNLVFFNTHQSGGSCVQNLDYCVAHTGALETKFHLLSINGSMNYLRVMLSVLVRPGDGLIRLFTVLLLLVGCTFAAAGENLTGSLAGANRDTDDNRYTLTDIRVNRRDIFDAEVDGTAVRHVYRAIDALHVTTREKTILREIDLTPGQQLTRTEVAELERNLRALGIFASVSVRLVPLTDSSAELHINTHDRLSIVFGASGSFLGGIGELGFTVGERNVNGSGDRLLLSYSGTTDGQLRGAVAYDDIHFIDNEHAAAYSAGRTEEGRFYHFQFSRPFKTRASTLSWSVKAESVGNEIDYYENGVSVAQVPQQSESVILEGYRRGIAGAIADQGFPRYLRYGAVLRFDRKRFEPTTGLQPDLVTAPLDNTKVFAGALLAVSRDSRFEKVRGVDAVRFTEDLSFGYSAEVLAGVNRTNDSDDVSDTEPAVFVDAQYAFGSVRPRAVAEHAASNWRVAHTFGKVSFNGFSNLQSGNDRSWSAGVTLKLFNRSLRSHTLASRISYVTSDRGDELPAQYTLGENNGLRGYAARQFSGSNRLRINLEDRIFTGWRLGALDLGALVFVDAGWAGDDTSQLSLRSSAGVGMRVGSNALLGADIVRLDFAYPFNPVDGQTRLSVSLSLGQVFSF
jgi:hypothetical protein